MPVTRAELRAENEKLNKQLDLLQRNDYTGDYCDVCKVGIREKEARMEERGVWYHPLCKVANERDRLLEQVETLKKCPPESWVKMTLFLDTCQAFQYERNALKHQILAFEEAKVQDLETLSDLLEILFPAYLHAKALRDAGRLGNNMVPISTQGVSALVAGWFSSVLEEFAKYGDMYRGLQTAMGAGDCVHCSWLGPGKLYKACESHEVKMFCQCAGSGAATVNSLCAGCKLPIKREFKKCDRDMDGDGKCWVHPDGCPTQ